MSNLKQYLIAPLVSSSYTLIILLYLSAICGCFWLMNQPDTLAFFAGIILIIFITSFVINTIIIKIKNKFKNKES